ncbi:hypothetical protein Q4603_20575 [Zobellia galactanivorans]|uniref:Conserved hypothetical periplasmic protein n=1 Tax=Zobellia galactanivorans (strain DSM 12802 / CCUG 47099 / CIP 106680 / NCIMB 13871 / Dsij) TaxID=63186 RepID=G0L0H5_ZOBGA|nr:hypothetical protein [Zobellia galactanivorans]MDO6811028.1 hypothetical protein [Zobellia galactanivorans]CAZ97406.1 Conserved hypothetical periplasmic protein [Zobellia galactanivorans]
MYLVIRRIMALCLLTVVSTLYSQNTNNGSLEFGALVAGDEALYYGGYGKYNIPLSQNKHHFTLGFSMVAYFDFKGESEPEAYLKNDIDMRLIPTANIGYSLNFKRIQLNFEVPIGLSMAITKGTLVNEKIGFERDFYNQEIFFNYGLSFSPKYKLNRSNSIGLYSFLPLIEDKTQSGYQIGIEWTKTFANRANRSAGN